MFRRNFWLGLLVGMIVMGLLAGTALLLFVRFRGSELGVYGLRGRPFGISPRGWFYPRTLGRWHGFGALLCGPVLLLAGVLVLGVLFGRRWHRRASQPVSPAPQPPSVSKAAEPEPEVSVASEPVEAAPPPSVRATQGPSNEFDVR